MSAVFSTLLYVTQRVLAAALIIAGFVVILLRIVGFAPSGVTARSKAAAAQSKYYGPRTRGTFSALQSAGTKTTTPYIGIAALYLLAGVVLIWKSPLGIVEGGLKVVVPAAKAIFDAAAPVAGRARDVIWAATKQGAKDAVSAAMAISDAAAPVAGRATDVIWAVTKQGAKDAVSVAKAISDAAAHVAGRATDVIWAATKQGAKDAVPAAKAISDAAALVAGRARDVIWAATKQGVKVVVPAAEAIFDAAREHLQKALR